MSVVKNKRKASAFEVFENATKIRTAVTDLLFRNFGYSHEKSEKKLQRKFEGRTYEELTDAEKEHYDRFQKRQEAFEKWYIGDERTAVLNLLRKMDELLFTANSNYPTCQDGYIQRRLKQDEAIGVCVSLTRELQNAIETLPVDVNCYTGIAEMIKKEISLIKGWRKADNKNFRAFSTSAANFANVNGNGNANYNNASNSNGVRPDFTAAIK